MLRNPTIEKLRDMKLKEVAGMFSEPDRTVERLLFEERFGLMVESQW